MRVEAYNMKSCLNCRFADAFFMPNKTLFGYGDVKVECSQYTTEDRFLVICGGCSGFKSCCNRRTVLKEN